MKGIPAEQATVLVDGVRRPVLNSLGQPIHATEAGIKAFWRWFGDSQVVDKHGRPLVVYHGTEKGGFSSFDPDKSGSTTGRRIMGIYFGDDIKGAATYAGTKEIIHDLTDDPYLYERGIYVVYLKLKDPYVQDFNGQDWSAFVEMFEGIDEVVEYAKGAGFDGVIATNISDEGRYGQGYSWSNTTFVVFSPTQIKSATGNRGTFDPSDPVLTNPDLPTTRQYRKPTGKRQVLRYPMAAFKQVGPYQVGYQGRLLVFVTPWGHKYKDIYSTVDHARRVWDTLTTVGRVECALNAFVDVKRHKQPSLMDDAQRGSSLRENVSGYCPRLSRRNR